MSSYIGRAAQPLVHGVQDGVLHNVLVELLSSTDRRQLGDHGRQTHGGVVSQRHVSHLEGERGGENMINAVEVARWDSLRRAYAGHTSAYLKGVKAVVHDDVDVVHVQGRHALDPHGGVLESHQAHVKVDLVQVATVERVELKTASGKTMSCFSHWSQCANVINELTFEAKSVM